MLPVLVAVLAAYMTGNVFNRSIYDVMLELNNLPRPREMELRRRPTRERGKGSGQGFGARVRGSV